MKRVKSICDANHQAHWWPGFNWLGRFWWLRHDCCKAPAR